LEKMQLVLGLSRRGFDRGEVLKGEGEGLDCVWFFVYGRAEVCTRLTVGREREFVIDEL
jgi:CRP-like cAMP-binding protein